MLRSLTVVALSWCCVLAEVAARELTRLECLTAADGFADGVWANWSRDASPSDAAAAAAGSFEPNYASGWGKALRVPPKHAGRCFYWRPRRPECALARLDQQSVCRAFGALDAREVYARRPRDDATLIRRSRLALWGSTATTSPLRSDYYRAGSRCSLSATRSSTR